MLKELYVKMLLFSCISILHVLANTRVAIKHGVSLITSLSICFSNFNPIDYSIPIANAATTKQQSLSEQLKVIQALQNRPTVIPVKMAERGVELDELEFQNPNRITYGTINLSPRFEAKEDNNNNNPTSLYVFVAVNINKSPIAMKKYENINSFPLEFELTLEDLLPPLDKKGYMDSFVSRSSMVVVAVLDDDDKLSTISNNDLFGASYTDPTRVNGNFFGRSKVDLILGSKMTDSEWAIEKKLQKMRKDLDIAMELKQNS